MASAASTPKIITAPPIESGLPKKPSARGIWLTIRVPAEDVVGAGVTTEDGETEERDAEAEWKGDGFRGRWAIRASVTCSGETVIQVLSTNR